ncbi:Cytosolic iron-sulfur protein assembly protein, partial [Neophaeococcomyces mojaviensis]
RLPGAFEDEDAEQERDFTHTGGDEENEDWHFSTLLTGPDSEIKDVKFSPAHYGATLLATCSRDKSVWVWEEVEPEEWETIAVLSEHTGDVKCLAWCEAGRTSRRALKKRLEQRRKATSGVTGEEQSAMDVDATNGGATAGDDDDEEIIVGGRELLASGSYDDTIRLYHDDESEGDWICIAVLTGHDGTVWDLKFEPYIDLSSYTTSTTAEEIIADWTPRILSCSDDLSIRVWRKVLKEKERIERRSRIEAARQGQTGGHDSGTRQRQTGFVGQMPSVIRVGNSTEQWIEETRLPAVHMRSVYAIDWSSRTGLVVSCGGDGLIAVYREVPAANNGGPGIPGPEKDAPMSNDGTTQDGAQEEQEVLPKHKTEWKVVAAVEAAHDEYEINHVCWAPRRDARQRQLEGGKAVVDGGDEGGQEDEEEEEYVVSTGDDGDVRVWRMPEEVLRMVRDEVYE